MARIWICGNERDATLLTERVLHQLGHESRVVAPAALATAMEENRPDLLILDLREDVHGLRLLQTLQQRERLPRILVTTTAAPLSDHVARARRMGAEVYFMRPLDIDVLERTVAGLLPQSEGGDPAARAKAVTSSTAT